MVTSVSIRNSAFSYAERYRFVCDMLDASTRINYVYAGIGKALSVFSFCNNVGLPRMPPMPMVYAYEAWIDLVVPHPKSIAVNTFSPTESKKEERKLSIFYSTVSMYYYYVVTLQ